MAGRKMASTFYSTKGTQPNSYTAQSLYALAPSPRREEAALLPPAALGTCSAF